MRLVIILFWVGLLVGTLLAHNLVANWAVGLAGLYFLARWWHQHRRERRARTAVQPVTRMSPTERPRQSPPDAPPPAAPRPRSRWTVDHVHDAERRWH